MLTPMTTREDCRHRDAWIRLCRSGEEARRHRRLCRRLKNAKAHEPGTRLLTIRRATEMSYAPAAD